MLAQLRKQPMDALFTNCSHASGSFSCVLHAGHAATSDVVTGLYVFVLQGVVQGPHSVKEYRSWLQVTDVFIKVFEAGPQSGNTFEASPFCSSGVRVSPHSTTSILLHLED